MMKLSAFTALAFFLVVLFVIVLWQPNLPPGTLDGARDLSRGEAPALLPVVSSLAEASAEESPFLIWAERYLEASAAARPSLLEKGRALAVQRSEQMLDWMRSDPERAWKNVLSLRVYAGLPDEVASLIERPFAGIGSYERLPNCGIESGVASGDRHQLKVNGETLTWYPFGRRDGLSSKQRVGAFGLRLGKEAVLQPSPVHRLSADEFEAAEAMFETGPRGLTRDPITLNESDGTMRALIGNMVFAFEDGKSLANLESTLSEIETLIGPEVFEPILVNLASGGSVDLPGMFSQAQQSSSDWTETPKKVLFIRVDFSDNVGNPIDDIALGALISESSDQIVAMSYGKTSILQTVAPTVYRLPQTAASYQTLEANSPAGQSLGADAIEVDTQVLAGADYTLEDYDIYVYLFANIGISWDGLATRGGSNQWINGSFEAETMVHEFGHNYGLPHARFWSTTDGSAFGTGGELEYGDVFDIMGSCPTPQGHFNMWAKHELNWIEGPEVSEVTDDKVYRIHRVDHTTTSGTKALRIPYQNDDSIWLGYRRSLTTNPLLKSGAYVTWKSSSNLSRLVDTTPDSEADSTADREDAPLQVGKTLTTSWTESATTETVHITPVAYGGSAPNEYIDVCVMNGAFPGNQAPTGLAISGPTTAQSLGEPITLKASATDADGDPIYYGWDFGDGTAHGFGDQVEKVFVGSGTYTVTVTATDCKGGSASATMVITVSDPWTQRTYAESNRLYDMAYGNGLYVIAGHNYAAYSSEGNTWNRSQSIGINQFQYRVAFGGGAFVGVGQDYDFSASDWRGTIQRSVNGSIWTTPLNGELRIFRDVAYGSGAFVAVGTDGMIYSSADGTAWTDRSVSPAIPDDFRAVAYGDGVFVAVGTDSLLYRSTDAGTTWTAISTPFFHGKTVRYDGNQFVIITSYGSPQDVLTSSDGLSWDYLDTDIEIFANDMVVTDGFYYITGDWSGVQTAATSIDGAAWVTAPSHSAAIAQNGVAFANGRLFSVGDNGTIYEADLISQGLPQITEQPNDSAREAGEMGVLAVTAIGDATLSYQWYEGDSGDESSPLASKNAASLSMVVPATPTRYWVKITNSVGSVHSETAMLQTNTAPVVGSVANISVPFNADAASFVLSLSDDLTPCNDLDISMTSTLGALVDTSRASLSTGTGQVTISVSLQSNVSGLSTITAYVTDEHGACTNISFTITVLPHTAADPVIFEQSDDIALFLYDTATPYPSSLSVSGLTGNIMKTRLTLRDYASSDPIHTAALLVAPSGDKMVPWYAVGGGSSVSNVDIAFEDNAAATLGISDTPTSGIYAPSHQVDPMWNGFASPAPSVPNGLAFSVFDGDSPNGIWDLYFEDPFTGDSSATAGRIDCWELALWTDSALSEPLSWLASRQLPLSTDFTMDPESNGESLLVEYAFGLGVDQVEPEIDGGATSTEVCIEFDRRKGALHGLTYIVEENGITPDPDDQNWGPATVQELNVLQDNGDGTERVEAKIASGSGARKFVRVRVTMQ